MKQLFTLLLLVVFMTSGKSQITEQFTLSLQDISISTENGYDRLDLSSGAFTNNVVVGYNSEQGDPELPMLKLSFLVPINSSGYSTQINNEVTHTYAGTYNIYPTQPSGKNLLTPANWVEPDQQIYSSANPYPSNQVAITNKELTMGYKIITVYVSPFLYTPTTQQLSVLTQFDVVINYNTQQGVGASVRPERISSSRHAQIIEILSNSLINASDLSNFTNGAKSIEPISTSFCANKGTGLPSKSGNIPDMIIITKNDLKAPMESYAKYKTKRGMPAIVMTTEEIEAQYQGCDTQQKIYNYLRDVYLSWGPMYILLGGDVNLVPIRRVAGGTYISDFYYSDIIGLSSNYNWNANGNHLYGEKTDGLEYGTDHFVGRLSFKNINELGAIINKIKSYETGSLSNLNYLENVLLMHYGIADESNTPFDHKLTDYYQYLSNSSKWRMFNDEPYQVHYDEVFNKDNAYACLNNGGAIFGEPFHLVYHTDHSGPVSLGAVDASISTSEIMNLSNGDNYQVVLSGGCNINEFDHFDNSISESFLKNPNGGAVAIIGASRLNSNIVNFFKFMQFLYEPSFYSNRIGDLNVKSKRYYPTKERERNGKLNINLLADPTMRIWTHSPTVLNASVNQSSLVTGDNTFKVSVNNLPSGEQAMLCLFKDDEVYKRRLVIGTGSKIEETFNCVINSTGNLELSIVSKKYLPFYKQVPVNYSSSKHLYVSNYSISDNPASPAVGNNNGIVESGESIELSISLKNNGLTAASNVTLNASTNSQYITINNGLLSFGSVSSQQTVSSSQPIQLSIDPTTPNGEKIVLDLLCKDGVTYDNSCIIEFEVHKMVPEIDLIDISTTSNNNNINPSDQAEFNFVIDNISMGTAQNMSGVLTTNDPDATIAVSTGDFTNAASNSHFSSKSSYYVDIASSYTTSSQLTFNLKLTNDFGCEWNIPFHVGEDIPTPTGLSSSQSSKQEANLTWDAKSNIGGYNVYRAKTSSGTYQQLNTQKLVNYAGYKDDNISCKSTYYYKVSCISEDGVEGDLSSTLKVETKLPYHSGFPISHKNTNLFGEFTFSTPMLSDITNDGNKEIISLNSSILCLDEAGNEVFDIDNDPNTLSGFYNFDNAISKATASIGDLDKDGSPEIITVTSGTDNEGDRKTLFVHHSYDEDNDDKPDEYFTTSIGSETIKGAVLSDLNFDGNLEIISKSSWGSPLYVLKNDGSGSFNPNNTNKWPKHYTSANAGGRGMPVAVDLDQNGYKEIIIGYAKTNNFPAGIYVYTYDGNNYQGNTDGLFFQQGTDDMDNPVCAGDINQDGYYDLVCVSQSGSSTHVFILDKDGNPLPGWGYNDHVVAETRNASAALGDVNGDSQLEVVFAANDKVHAWRYDGSTINSSFPVTISGLSFGDSEWVWTGNTMYSPLIGDIDSDDAIEIVVAGNTGIHAINTDGDLVDHWGLPVSLPTIALDDIDNDYKTELIATKENTVYAWDTEGDAGLIEWGKYRYDEYNSGIYGNQKQCIARPGMLSISQDKTITNRRILQDMEILDDATLTITGNVYMPEGKKIIVREGAQLIIDGGRLTTDCSNYWDGIVIEGDLMKSQLEFEASGLAKYHGKVILKNGAEISNALFGVKTRDGGILDASNTIFLNNLIGIDMHPYQNYFTYENGKTINLADRTRIENSTFKTTNNFIGTNDTIKHINLSWVNGIRIRGNTFINENNSLNQGEMGIGITSSNSSFRAVDQYRITDTKEKNVFENLFYGITTSGWYDNGVIQIKGNDFTNVYRSIKLVGSKYAEILNNNISISDIDFDIPLSPPWLASYGIYLDGGTGFKVEENEVTSHNNAGGIHGIVVSNTGPANNEIYNNLLYDLNVGIQPQFKNRGVLNNNNNLGPEDGLKLICNTFDNPNYDTWVAGKYYSGGSAGIGIAKYQKVSVVDNNGQTKYVPAGNVFSPTANHQQYGDPAEDDFNYSNKDAEHLEYHYWDNATNKEEPYFYSNITLKGQSVENTCPSSTPQTISDYYVDLSAAQTALNSSKLMLEIWENGGEAELDEEVETIAPWDVYEEFNNLTAESPYLSEEVIIEVIENEAFTALMVKLLMIANPHVINSDEVMEVLYERNPPLPESYIDEILKEEGESSQLDLLRADVAADQHMISKIGNNIKRKYRKDTTNSYALDSLINFTSRQHKLSDRYELASIFLANDMFDEMQSCLDGIPEVFELSDNQNQDYEDYLMLFEIAAEIKQFGTGIDQLDESQINTMIEIADNFRPGTSAFAISLLQDNDPGFEWNEIVLEPDEENKSGGESIEELKTSIDIDKSFSIYPNPAYDFVTAAYNTDRQAYKQLSIVMYNSHGKKVLEHPLQDYYNEVIIDLTKLSVGIYYVSLVGDGQRIATKKLNLID